MFVHTTPTPFMKVWGGGYIPHPPGITPVVASHNRRRGSLVIMGGRLVGHNNKTKKLIKLTILWTQAKRAPISFLLLFIHLFIYNFSCENVHAETLYSGMAQIWENTRALSLLPIRFLTGIVGRQGGGGNLFLLKYLAPWVAKIDMPKHI